MRSLLSAVFTLVLMAPVASAQYKTPAPAVPGQTPGGLEVPPNRNVQINLPNGEDELASARRISREEAMKMVKEGKAIYIDVRGKDAYEEGHIPGAINVPEGELIDKLKDLPPHKFLITYCA